ncbi:MAG: chromate efflux transporter [Verrucomicrobiota bacterium]
MEASELTPPSFNQAFRFWLKLGFISFGGPAGQIAIMQTELVDRRRWVSPGQFLHALNYCMLLPGPEAQQLAIYLGWLFHRIPGGIVAGVLFVLPSVFILWGLSYVYVAFGSLPWVAAIFYGLKPAITAIVLVALIRIGGRALRSNVAWSVATLAFISTYFFHLPFPLIIIGAGALGFAYGTFRPGVLNTGHGHAAVTGSGLVLPSQQERQIRGWRGHVPLIAAWVALWFAPTVLAGAWKGWQSTLCQEGIFFSKAAVVTFGGAYAVLPYVAQEALHHGWLGPGQMVDGLGLAETTPGPLIMVLQFVGFLAAWQHPEGLPPLLAATLGAAITTWSTFTPCFLWIFLGAPYIQRLHGHARLTAALTAITAAIVGVILNLAVWFATHVYFPRTGQIDWFAITLSAMALFGLLRWKWNVIPVVIASGVSGVIYQILRGP